MSRVLVTGHLGYVGSVLTPVLRNAGHAVIGLDSDLYRRCATGNVPPVATIRKDIRDVTPQDFEKTDSVVHLAALSNDPLGYLNPQLTSELNHRAAVNVALAAKAAGVRRFIFLSTCSVYGHADHEIIDETHPPSPITPYAESKWHAEDDILELNDPNFEAVVLRPGTAYGWSPKLRFDLVVNNLVAWAQSTGLIRLKGDGHAWRPIVHVADIAGVIAAVLGAPSAAVAGKIFNLGRNQENYRIIDLAQAIAKVLTGCRITFAEQPLHDTRSYRVDCTRLSAALPNHQWAWSLQDGIADLKTGIGQLNLDIESFEGPEFSRSAHLLALQENGLLDEKMRLTDETRGEPAASPIDIDRPRLP